MENVEGGLLPVLRDLGAAAGEDQHQQRQAKGQNAFHGVLSDQLLTQFGISGARIEPDGEKAGAECRRLARAERGKGGLRGAGAVPELSSLPLSTNASWLPGATSGQIPCSMRSREA